MLSDSLGETGELVIRAALSQFNTKKYKINRFAQIQSVEELDSILQEIKDGSLILYTFVREDLIERVKEFENRDVLILDLISPIIKVLSERFKLDPSKEPGLNRRLDDEYFSRISAIEFAVKYDDGKDPRGFKKADLVLIGVSRTSKTPLSMYLANKNIKVANLPLVLEAEPPEELFEIPAKNVIGLTNSPQKLLHIREERLKSLGVTTNSNYTDMHQILDELEYAEQIMRRIGCPIIDVSNKAIEETSQIIINLLKKNGVDLYNRGI